MKNDEVKVEQRLQNMKKFYLKAGDIIDQLSDAIPEKTRTMIKDVILGDTELKSLMEGIDSHRPPRIFMIGRTGVGKSSLINALCGAYVAPVSNTRSCTNNAYTYQCKDGDRVLMEIMDTRGIAESEALDDDVSAEQMLIDQISKFSPDVAIFMLNCMHRDDVEKDVEFLKKVSKKYSAENDLKLPIVVVVNKCDEMAPSRVKSPLEYPQKKKDNIKEVVQNYKGIIIKHGLKIERIIDVSSLIDWQTPDGVEVAAEDIENLPDYDIQNLCIAYDSRYGIEELFEILCEAIQDFEAQMGMRMAFRLEELVRRIAKHLNHIFSSLSATAALSPIPVSDIHILLMLQSLLIALISSLSGRDVSLDAAKEFVLSLGGVAGAGYTFRLLAQQGAKFMNVIWPGAGSAVSSGIAFLGTEAIGNAAIAYYIDEQELKCVKEKFEEDKKEYSYSGK